MGPTHGKRITETGHCWLQLESAKKIENINGTGFSVVYVTLSTFFLVIFSQYKILSISYSDRQEQDNTSPNIYILKFGNVYYGRLRISNPYYICYISYILIKGA